MSKKIKNIKKYTLKKVVADPLYKSYWYSKFVNKFMLDGKKHIIEKIISQVWYDFKLKHKLKPILILFVSLHKIKPLMGTIPKRLGKIWKQVPVPLTPRRQLVIALKWLVQQIKFEPELNLRAKIIRTFTKLLQKKSKNKRADTSDLIRTKRLHYYQIIKDRVNTRFRWR